MSEKDTAIKLALYRGIADTGEMPDAAKVAELSGFSQMEVQQAFHQLQAQRLLVLEPGDSRRIRMAPPFSGIPTAFPVHARGRRYYANCVWDAFGVAAALHADAIIGSVDGFSGEPLQLEVRGGQPVRQPYVAHFAVPAAKWWENIVFT